MLIDCRDGPQELTDGPGRTSQTICSLGIVAFGSAAGRSNRPLLRMGASVVSSGKPLLTISRARCHGRPAIRPRREKP